MSESLPEKRLFAINLVRDLLTDLSNDGSGEIDIQERQDYFGQVAELIFDELGIDLVSVEENGSVVATITPPDGWN